MSTDAAADAGLPVEYAEPARSYRSVWLLALVLLAGFGIDLGFSVHGALTHLPGWLIAAALVLGVDVLVIYAARATKSLALDAGHLTVGDDAVERAAIVSSRPGADDESPVLGWPTGLPRGTQAVTLRLVDGSEVAVPTRRPVALRAALGHDTVAPDDAEHVDIRPAEDADLAELADVERRASVVFEVSGRPLPDGDPPDYTAVDALAIFVAGRPPVGFVHLTEVDGQAHLRELDVLPRAMRRGIGGRLLETAADWARAHGYESMTLTTFADVAWNGPYYAARGFVETAASTPGLRAVRERERERGLDGVGPRIVMRRALRP